MAAGRIAVVVFDLGGVICDSPLDAIARYERDHGLPARCIDRAVVTAGAAGAWARLERGELTVEAFHAPFEADCRAQGLAVSGPRLMAYIAEASRPRPPMLEAVRRIRAAGLGVAALTNNWVRAQPGPHPLRGHFPVFIESSVVGLRKPDPRIYELACSALGVRPSQAAFLDDIGTNLKSARALGMTTVKVTDAEAALRELGALLDLDLLSPARARRGR
jgi:putative hydrolase of the HAD superfamily